MAEKETVNARLTVGQMRELARKCSSQLNWSDGGHWIGREPAPNCFQRDVVRNQLVHVLHFPDDDSATKWNLECEKMIRYAGHIGTAAMTVGVTLATGGVVAPIIVGLAVALAKDELQARISYPRMARGWSYELILENEFFWTPHPWGRKSFLQKTTTVSRNWEEIEVTRRTNKAEYRLNELPDGVARTIASVPSKKTWSNYG